jgi:methylmalonyl-CoA mutase, C-terminal domain
MAKKLRILIGKPGLDGHDRGAKVIARALRDAGVEVIYTGLHQTPEMIVQTAIQEGVDGIGLSIMSGAHNTLMPAVVELLTEKGIGDIVVFGGGIIPEEDIPFLQSKGVKAIFTPGTSIAEVLRFLKTELGWEGDPEVATRDPATLVTDKEKAHHK